MNENPKPIIHLRSIHNYDLSEDYSTIVTMLQASPVIFIVQEGIGSLQLGDIRYAFQRGQAYAILPEMHAQFIESNISSGVRGFFISLYFYDLSSSTPDQDQLRSMPWPFPIKGRLEGVSEREWLSAADQLSDAISTTGYRAIVEAEVARSRLLVLLMACSESHTVNPVGHAISQTITYMNKHYAMSLDRHRLAQIAEMSVWHYSELFKKQIGQSPIAYLNMIRLHAARKRLISTELSIIEIARQVGYADEFYFSRKFKQVEGMSPSVYRQFKRKKVAAASFPYTGQFLALDVVPYVAVVDQERDSHRSAYFNQIPFQLHRSEYRSEEVQKYNMSVIRKARPEIIMCSEEEAATYQSLYGTSIPLVVIPWMELDWRQQFCRIADVLGKRKVAETWLKNYDYKVKRAAKSIQARIGRETVSIIHVKDGQLYVYGKRNGGSVLFNGMGLKAAYPYEKILVCYPVSPDELAQFAGEHMIVVLNQEASSRGQWNNWCQSGIWQDLVPFRKHQVHEVSEMPWLDYSAHGHALIVDEALRLFTNPSYIHGQAQRKSIPPSN